MTLEQRMSLEDFLTLPEEKPYREYLYGRVVKKPLPKREHSLVQLRIGQKLGNWIDGGAPGEASTEQRCILSTPSERHAQLPDVAWFSRTPELDDHHNALTPPDLAVEVLSPDDPYRRVKDKIRIYLEAGTKVVWLVDPERRTVEVFRRSREPEAITDEGVLEDPVLPGFRLSLVDLFKPLER